MAVQHVPYSTGGSVPQPHGAIPGPCGLQATAFWWWAQSRRWSQWPGSVRTCMPVPASQTCTPFLRTREEREPRHPMSQTTAHLGTQPLPKLSHSNLARPASAELYS